MGLINKCSICENKGFLLKLENSLCIDCSNELRHLENEYTKLLHSISLNPNSKESYSKKLSLLIPDIKKFSSYSTVLNMDLITELITSLSLNIEKNPENFNSKLSYTTSSTNFDNPNVSINTTKNNESYIPVDNSSNLDSSLNEVPILTNEYVEDSPNDYLDTSAEIEGYNPLLNPSEKIIIDNIYNTTSNLLNLLNDSTLSLNELGKNFFKLKTSYYPLLKQYNITEVNSIDISNYLSTLERKLCHLTNTTSNDLFSFFNYVTVAIQTSGVNKDSNYILEISSLKINYGEITGEFYTLINPMRTINTDVTKRTGITSDMISSSPTLDIALLKLEDFIENYNLVLYNSANVLSFLDFNFNKLFGYTLKNNNTCCLRLYRSRYKKFYGEAPKVYDIYNICLDMLSKDDINNIENFDSISKSTSLALYKLFEILKYKYK